VVVVVVVVVVVGVLVEGTASAGSDQFP